ncbi:ArsR family transcriptional regulator [Gammaproteobacteria bacterium SCGC AG-212-F23]|nr:ArsR family transcriptional regulator [Gammaproteobacteria bacterium SCGC AG-212-F23]
MAKRNKSLRTHCVFELTMDIIGGKWKGVILHRLFEGTKRFVELKKLMPDITPRMLTLQLRELEADKIVCRKVYAEVPPRVEYSLTTFGKALEPAFAKISEWGRLYTSKIKKP